MFASVIHSLREHDRVPSIVVPLDSAYGQGAADTAAKLGLRVANLQLLSPSRSYGTFYNRSVPRIWADVLRARAEAQAWLTTVRPRAVVVGNDNGLVEKLFLHLAAQLRVPRILVQDGRLSEGREDVISARGRILRIAKRALSPVLMLAGHPYLASSEYGEGDLTHICASGPHGAGILSSRARPGVIVRVTGQPRYDSIPRDGRAPAESRRILFFTTPFAAERVGASSQLAQDRFLTALASALAPPEWQLVVKPHPRERTSHYRQLLGPSAEVSDSSPHELFAQAHAALIGVSTLVEEAAIFGCPVLVPGEIIHEGRFGKSLPAMDAYPRLESVDDAVSLLIQLRSDRELVIQQQRVRVATEIDMAPGATGRVCKVVRDASSLERRHRTERST